MNAPTEKDLEKIILIETLMKGFISENTLDDSLERSALLSSYKRLVFVFRSVELRFIKSASI